MRGCFIYTGLVLLASGLASQAIAATATFEVIKDPIPQTWSNFALSADGTVMAAIYGGEIYRWTASGGFQDLGPGDPNSESIGISADGSAIISGHVGADGFASPAIWRGGKTTDLGHPKNGCTQLANSWGSGYGLNTDGTIGVGLAWYCQGAEGFEWTAKTGNISLGHPSGNHSSRASAISANGKTIVGFWEDSTGPRRPVRWVGGEHDLFLGSQTIGEASAVTSSGVNIVGQTPNKYGNGVAFLFCEKKGLQLLGTLHNFQTDQSYATGLSDNERVIGWSGNPFGGGTEAFTWTQKQGMKKLAKVLRSLGAQIPAGTILTTATAISADGTTMVGQYVDSQLNFGNWMAHITK